MGWVTWVCVQALQMKQLAQQQSEGPLINLPKGRVPLPEGVTLPVTLALGPCGLARRNRKATFFAAVQVRAWRSLARGVARGVAWRGVAWRGVWRGVWRVCWHDGIILGREKGRVF